MKSLKESLLEQSRLSESLFDDDLVTKSTPINQEGLMSNLLDEISKHSTMKNWKYGGEWNGSGNKKWDVCGINNSAINPSISSLIWIYKSFDIYPEQNQPDHYIKVRVNSAVSPDGSILAPYIEFLPSDDDSKACESDSKVAARWIGMKYKNDLKINKGDYLTGDSGSIDVLIDIIVKTFDFFASDEGEKLIRKEIDNYYTMGKNIPPVVLDQSLMKKAINSL